MGNKFGLVFSGGGGKGAYEVGVWKALKEFGVDKNIAAVSGTSIGGLNGGLFVNGDFVKAENLWESISPEKILQVNVKKMAEVIAGFAIPGLTLKVLLNSLSFMKARGCFSQKGLESMIDEGGFCTSVSQSNLPFYICALKKQGLKLCYKKLNGLNEEEIKLWLLATSAIPVIFTPIEINGELYLDGGVIPGYSDNTPVKPLIENEGCKRIISVMLGRSAVSTDYEKKYPNVKFWKIIPTEEVGEVFGGLNFKVENAVRLIDMGYNDTCKILQQIYEFTLIEERYVENVDIISNQDNSFKKLASNNLLLRENYSYDDLNPKISSIQYLLDNNSDSSNGLQKEAQSKLVEGGFEQLTTQLEKNIQKAELELIGNSIDEVIDGMKSNSDQLVNLAFEGITSLSATEGHIHYQSEQGLVSKIWGTFTGKNQELQTEVNWDLNRSIYANQQMIKKLIERDVLTMDVCISLGNKINYLSMYQSRLETININHLNMIKQLRNGILSLADITRESITKISMRVEQLEYKDRLRDFKESARLKTRDMNDYQKIAFLASSFYSRFRENITIQEQSFFYDILCSVGLDKSKIFPSEFIKFVTNDKDNVKELLLGNNENNTYFPTQGSKTSCTPFLNALGQIFDTNKTVSFNEVMEFITHNYKMDIDIETSASDFTMELFTELRLFDNSKLKHDKLVNSMKADLLETINFLADSEINLFDSEINELINEISDFSLIIPVTGKFSSGKSRLLNCFLEKEEQLPTDTSPETAFATELHYNPKEQLIIYKMDGSSEIKQVSDISLLNSSNNNIAYLKLYLNNQKLKNRSDMVIVDMPGLESGKLDHNKAINLYVNRGHHYIFCVSCDAYTDNSILQYIKEFSSYKGFSIILTKTGRKETSEIAKIKDYLNKILKDREIIKDNIFIASTEADDYDIDDFNKIIDGIYCTKGTIFKSFFAPKYDTLYSSIINHLQILLKNKISLDELEEKIDEHNRSFEKYEKKINCKLDDMQYKIVSGGSEKIYNTIQSILTSNIATLKNAAKNGSMEYKVQDLIRPSVNNIIKEITEKTVAEFNISSVKIHAESELGGISTPPLNIPTESMAPIFAGTGAGAAVGFIVLGPIGAVIGGLIGYFCSGKSSKDEEIISKIRNQVIPEILSSVSTSSENSLITVFEKIRTAVNLLLEKSKLQTLSAIAELKKEMMQNEIEHKKKQDQLNNTLDNIQMISNRFY